jgi:hypothetical protein
VGPLGVTGLNRWPPEGSELSQCKRLDNTDSDSCGGVHDELKLRQGSKSKLAPPNQTKNTTQMNGCGILRARTHPVSEWLCSVGNGQAMDKMCNTVRIVGSLVRGFFLCS